MCYKNIAIITNQLINFIKKNRILYLKEKIKKYPKLFTILKLLKKSCFMKDSIFSIYL